MFSLIVLHANFINAQPEKEDKEFVVNVLGGISIPMGDFGTSKIEKHSGYALVGLTIGIGFIHPNHENLNWITDCYVAFNGYNEDVRQVQIGNSVNVDAGTYLNTWILTGLRISGYIAQSVKLFVYAQGGILFSSIPDITYSSNDESIEQTTDMGIAPAFGMGAGININSFGISIRYLTGKAEHEQTIEIGRSIGTADIKIPVDLLQVMLSINL